VLAYVFSHRPAHGADVTTYEEALREFHRQLAAARLRGFVSSLTFRVGDGYSDWYLVEDSSVLDGLNEVAVTGARAPSHESIARMATDGVGKLLSLVAGEHGPAGGCEARFGKPEGMTYAELYAALRPVTSGRGAGLWRRMMVLGPAPEFAITSLAPVKLPAPFHAETLTRSPI
jgi:hypothetical protein